MQIHRIHGRDLKDALERAGRMHGPQALVLGHEQVDGGVTVAVADARRSQIVARTPRSMISRTKRAPGLDDVARAMQRTGCSKTLTREVLDEVGRGKVRGAYALDAAARLLARKVQVAPSPKVPSPSTRTRASVRRPYVLAFVGPDGAGKTTSIAKLAARLTRAERRVGLVTLDGRRASAKEKLAGFARLIQAPVDVSPSAADLARTVQRSRRLDVLLVDGSGAAAHDVATLRELRALTPDVRVETYVVASAVTRRSMLDEAASQLSALEPSGLVVTHLDQTKQPGPILEHSMEVGLPLAFLSAGSEIAEGLFRPKPDHVADLFLRGRLS